MDWWEQRRGKASQKNPNAPLALLQVLPGGTVDDGDPDQGVRDVLEVDTEVVATVHGHPQDRAVVSDRRSGPAPFPGKAKDAGDARPCVGVFVVLTTGSGRFVFFIPFERRDGRLLAVVVPV